MGWFYRPSKSFRFIKGCEKMIKKNGFLIIISFFLLLSILANIYSFNRIENSNNEYINEIKSLKKENKELIQSNNEEEKNNVTRESKDNDSDSENDENKEEEDELKEENNTITKFVEYVFNTDEDSYTTRKKIAKEYMTDDLFETYFSSDSIDSEEMKINVEVKEVEVFHGYENDNAIVRYVIQESKAEGEYQEEIEKYSFIKLNDGKVSEINSLSNNEWGV